MQFNDREITDEDRSGIKAITEEYPSAARFMKGVFVILEILAGENQDDRMKTMLGLELGLRSAIEMDRDTLRQVVEMIDRGRAKVGNDETTTVADLMVSLIQMNTRGS